MITPTPTTSQRSKIVVDATLKVYQGAPHGLTLTHDQFNADLLEFIQD